MSFARYCLGQIPVFWAEFIMVQSRQKESVEQLQYKNFNK